MSSGVQRLAADVAALQRDLQEASTSGDARMPVWELKILPAGNAVSFFFIPGEGAEKVTVQVTFGNTARYPRSGVSLSCGDETVSSILDILAADRGDASLPRLLDDLCDLYGMEAGGVFENLAHQEGYEEAEEVNELEGGCEACGEGIDCDDSDEGDEMANMAEVEDRELTIACARRQSRWERHEELATERRERDLKNEKNRAPDQAAARLLSMEQAIAEERQIFAPREAFTMLSRELLDLIRKGASEHADIYADAVGDDVYQWDVRLTGFGRETALAQGLVRLQEKYGYCEVQLRVTFMRGLHPFYPPTVELVRPRMSPVVACALASHPLLCLERWDPWKPCAELLYELKAFLQVHGAVDIDSPFNSPDDFPASAYAPLEQQLVALEALSTEKAQAANMIEFADMFRSRDSQVDTGRVQALERCSKRMKRDPEEKPKQYWAAGTGYGTADGSQYTEVWDQKRSMAAQAARDSQLEQLLLRLALSLQCHLSSSEGLQVSPSEGDPSDIDDLEAELLEASRAYMPLLDMETIRQDVHLSCVLPFLGKELSDTSFGDMSSRSNYYSTCLRVVQQLIALGGCSSSPPRECEHCIVVDPWSARLSPGALSPRVVEALKGLDEQAQCFLKVVRKGRNNSTATDYTKVTPGSSKDTEGQEKEKKEAGKVVELSELIVSVHTSMVAAMVTGVKLGNDPALSCQGVSTRSTAPDCSGRSVDAGGEAQTSTSGSKSQDTEHYCWLLKPRQVECGCYKAEFMRHYYIEDVKNESVHPTSRILKIGREIAALHTMLPLHPSSSIFVRVDEESSMLWRVMITGPEDTPYSCGCFIFDVYFPVQYPAIPPKVNLQTTGSSSVRFNPNLYKDGKVCLSLLGTWDGHKSETWDPQISSIFQVLVSIQSLIFVPQPYFNEPGYEKRMGDDETMRKSDSYNRAIREATLEHAVLAQLNSPPKEFADAIQSHMKLRRSFLLSQCEAWVKDAVNGGERMHQRRLESLIHEINSRLEKLGA